MSFNKNGTNEKKIISIGIFAHANAGKTTVTEQFLFHSGVKKEAGRVDHGDTSTDSLHIERQRGISVRAAVVRFTWRDTIIQLIDTPGHVDFSAEVERSMRVLEGAVLVISAAEGIQPQTWTIWNALKRMRLPTLVYINKADRVGADTARVVHEIKKSFGIQTIFMNKYSDGALADTPQYLKAEELSYIDDDILAQLVADSIPDESVLEKSIRRHLTGFRVLPAYCGSALHDVGIKELLDGVSRLIPRFNAGSDELSALVFRIEHTQSGRRNIWVKVVSGQIVTRDIVSVHGKDSFQVTSIYRSSGSELTPCRVISAGDIGVINGSKSVMCGDILGEERLIPPAAVIASPLLGMQVVPKKTWQWYEALNALLKINDEDPHLNVRWDQTRREVHVDLMGPLQAETLEAMLMERFGIEAAFELPTVLYKEAPLAKGIGKAAGARCSGVEITIEPDDSVESVTFESRYSVDWLYVRYQRQVERLALDTLKQGLCGFPVIHARVLLTGGWCDSVSSDPSHFNIAAPLAVMRALKMCETELWEPVLRFECTVPEECTGACLALLASKRCEFSTQGRDSSTYAHGTVPASEAADMPVHIARLTNGKGFWLIEMSHYAKTPQGTAATRTRIGPDPKDEEMFIMHMNGVKK